MSDRLRCALCEQQYADGETVDQHNWSKHPAIMLSMGETPPSAETPSEPPKLQGDGPHMDPLFALTEQLEKCAGHVKAVADAMGLNLLHDDSRQARPQALSYVRPSELAGRVKLLMDATRSASAEASEVATLRVLCGEALECIDGLESEGDLGELCARLKAAAAPPSVGDTKPRCQNCGKAEAEHDAKQGYCLTGGDGEDATSWEPETFASLRARCERLADHNRTLMLNQPVDLDGFAASKPDADALFDAFQRSRFSCPACQSPTRPTCFNPNCEAAFPELHAAPTGTPRAVTDENAARLISRVKAGLQGGTRTMFDGLAALSALEDFLASRAGHRSGGGA